jgi:hypothetical protein
MLHHPPAAPMQRKEIFRKLVPRISYDKEKADE